MRPQNSYRNVSGQNQKSSTQRTLNIVESVSTSGKYQRKLIIYLLCVAFFCWLPIYSSHLFYVNPVFSCQNMEGKVVEDVACRIIDFCTLINKGTITQDLQLYCDSQKDRIFIQTAQGYGVWLGLLLVMLMSDRFGRKTCFIIGIIFANFKWILQLIGVQTRSVWLLFIADFMSGISNKSITINFLIIATRFVKKGQNQMVTLGFLLLSRGWTQMFVAAINQFFNSWRITLWIFTIGIASTTILAFFILKEDPVFLIEDMQTERAKRVIQQIGQQNGEQADKIKQATDDIDIITQQIQNRAERGDNKENEYNLKEILRCDIILNVFLIGLAGFFNTLSSKSIQYSIQQLKYSYNFNLFLLGFSNSCGFFTAIWLMKVETKRKRGLLYSMFLYCIIAMLFFFPFCTQSGIVQSLVIFLLRLFTSWISNFYVRLQVDSLPQKYQGTLMGVTQVMIDAGTVYGPPITQKIIERHINPILVIAIAKLTFGIIPMLLIKEEKISLDMQSNLETDPPVKKDKQ